MDSLQGHFLIATAQMPDPRFREQVIYMCAHTDEGAMGLVINSPIQEVAFAEIFRQAGVPAPLGDLPPVRIGGPVELNAAFFLYSSDYMAKTYLVVTPSVHLSRDPEILMDLAKGEGPSVYLFFLGYAGWGPGQLERELTANGWLTVPGDEEVLFRTPDELKWKRAAQIIGVDIALFGDVMGTA